MVACFLLTSCSGRPNDLRHYADKTTGAPTSAVTSQPRVTASAPPSNDPAVVRRRAADVMLTDGLVAEIGFSPRGPQQATVLERLPSCSARLEQPTAGMEATWAGTTPATTLSEYIAGYQDVTGAQVLETTQRGLHCRTYRAGDRTYQVTPVELASRPVGVDAYYAWCEQSAVGSADCAVLLGRGKLVAYLQVAATAETRARNLLQQVVGPAATRLVTAGP